MSQLTNLKEHLVCIWTTLRASTIPQDGPERYIYDIWQPLTILALTASFMCTYRKRIRGPIVWRLVPLDTKRICMDVPRLRGYALNLL
jgi:hypothetical protein